MPFVSQAQAGWAFANKKPFAKRWARQTGPYKRLPYKKRTKALTLAELEAFVLSPHYDADTAAAIAARIPEIPSLKGEQIAPGITRIHGNLCNVHGRYGKCPGASVAPTKPVKPRKGRKRGARKPKKAQQTPEQKRMARITEHAQNRQKVLSGLGIAPDGQSALGDLADGEQPRDPSAIERGGLVEAGLVEQARDGSYRLSASGRAAMAAAASGDAGRAGAIISAARDRTTARGERAAASTARHEAATARQQAAQAKREQAQAARAKRQAAAQARRSAARGRTPSKQSAPAQRHSPPTPQPRKAGAFHFSGGPSSSGGSAPKPKKAPAPKPEKPTKEQTAASNRQSVRDEMMNTDQGLAPAGFDNLIALGGGKEPDTIGADGLISMHMAERGSDGVLRLTSAGRHAIQAANRGDAKEAIDIISRANEPPKAATKAASPGDFLVVEDPAKSSTWHLQVKRNGTPDHGLMGAAWAALHGGFRGNVYQGPSKGAALAKLKKLYASEGMDAPAEKAASFRVFKDAAGRPRWVAQSSTAFEDRDKEIVSTKALEDDCAYADKSGMYGPLRWWHTPGLDLGDCDFNAMHGRVLIESGTFRSPSIAQKVAAAADALEISLGFLHLPTEPDASGVFNHIRRFERSLVPRGKASNRFTAFSVKEQPMFDKTKVEALKTLGFTDSDITALQAQAEATEKAADAEHIAFKADEPAAEAAPDLPDVIINGVTYKAFPPKTDPTVEEADQVIEEDAVGDAPMDMAAEPEGDEGGLTLSPEDISAIGDAVAQALQAALGPLVSTMDLTNKIGSHMDELKSMMGGYTAKKDSSDAEKTEQIAALQTSLKATQLKLDELLGLQPEVAPRASAAPASALNPFNPADNALLAAVKDQIPMDQQPFVNGFEDLAKNLFGV